MVGPGEPVPEPLDQEEQLPVTAQTEEQKPAKTTFPENASSPVDSFVIVSDEDIVGEHLDEVFYKKEVSSDDLQQRDLHTEGEATAMRMRRESQKESGSVLFGSEETVLTPIFISPGPPKIIDPILLEEPTAMSFMYSDLYEDAVGERKKSDGEHSEADSATAELTYRRRLSDPEEADGYLEKFTLKDETPLVEVHPETPEDRTDGRMMWSQSKFEMTGCLTRAISEGDEDEIKMEEPKTREESKSEIFEDKGEKVLEKVKGEEEKELSEETKKGASGEESKLQEEEGQQMGHQDLKHQAKKEQTEPEESSTVETHQGTELVDCEGKCEDQGKPLAESAETQGTQLHQTQDSKDSATAETLERTGSCISQPSTLVSESTEELPEEEASHSLTRVANEKPTTECQNESKEPDGEGTILAAQTDTSEKTHIHEDKEDGSGAVPDNGASVEVIAHCDSSVHAQVVVSEKAVGQQEFQTQINIDLEEAEPSEAEAAEEGTVLEEELQDLVEPTTTESQAEKSFSEAEQGSEDKAVPEAVKPEVQEELNAGANRTQHDLETKMFPPEKGGAEVAAVDVKPMSEQSSTMETVNNSQERMKDELIVLVPKGQSVEMEIAMNQCSKNTTIETTVRPEVQSSSKDQTQLAVDVVSNKPSDKTCNGHLPVPEEDDKEQKVEKDSVKDETGFPALRSFSAQEDLSAPDRMEVRLEEADVGGDTVVQTEDSVSYTDIVAETPGRDTDCYTEREKTDMEEVPKAAEVIVEEPEYEVIYEKDANEIQGDAEKPAPETPHEEEEERIETVMEEEEEEETAAGLAAEDELIEADYDIIDAEEERQARLAAELQGMDWFCLTCGFLLAEGDCASGEHDGHEVTSVDSAYQEIKVRGSTFWTCTGPDGAVARRTQRCRDVRLKV